MRAWCREMGDAAQDSGCGGWRDPACRTGRQVALMAPTELVPTRQAHRIYGAGSKPLGSGRGAVAWRQNGHGTRSSVLEGIREGNGLPSSFGTHALFGEREFSAIALGHRR